MSFFSTLFRTRPASAAPGSGIRSATGLPRAAIAGNFRSAGLFGRDSDLSRAEQIVVQGRLGSLPGVPGLSASAFSAARMRAPRLRRLADYVDAQIAGQGREERAGSLRSQGFSPSALSEVERVVYNVEDIFGPRSLPAHGDVRESTLTRPACARAA